MRPTSRCVVSGATSTELSTSTATQSTSSSPLTAISTRPSGSSVRCWRIQPLLAPDRIGTDGASTYPPAIVAAKSDSLLPHAAAPLRHQTSAARHRERPLPGQEEHAPDRRASAPSIQRDARSAASRPCSGCGRASVSPARGRSASRTVFSHSALGFRRRTKRESRTVESLPRPDTEFATGPSSIAGLPGQFGVGLLLGAVWSPCVRPTLGAASLLVSQERDLTASCAPE